MYKVSRYGYGALCLRWSKDEKKHPQPSYVIKVPESIVSDMEAIQHVIPSVLEKKIDPNDVAVITNTSKALKNDLSKSIFTKVLGDKFKKAQNPNDNK